MTKTDDTGKIKAFLRTCNEFEFRYLQRTINLVDRVRTVIKDHNITPKEFCIAVRIPLSQYKAYVGGSYEYSFKDIAGFEILWQTKEKEKIERENQIIKIPAPTPYSMIKKQNQKPFVKNKPR